MNRIEEEWPDIALGRVIEERSTNYNYVYVGRKQNTIGYEYYFVCEGMPHWVYTCSYYDTLANKFFLDR